MDTVAKPIPGFDEFAEQLNSVFVAHSENGEAEFRLVEANDLFSDERSQSFSLLFEAPASVGNEQRIFHFMNTQLGEIDLFLVPVRQADDRLFFEASFNLVR